MKGWRDDARAAAAAHGYDLAPEELRALSERFFGSPAGPSAVVMVGVRSYEPVALAPAVARLVEASGLVERARGARRIVVKPNFVEARDPWHSVTVHPALLATLLALLRRIAPAAHLTLADGPAHERDWLAMLERNGLAPSLERHSVEAVDLNTDDIVLRPVARPLSARVVAVPRTVAEADLVVSVAKLKTHHWGGVTLSLKNLMGIFPGSIYGLPRSRIHWMSYPRVTVDLATVLPPTCAVIDGVMAVQGNGPLDGDPIRAGVLIASADLLAADCVATRQMLIAPLLIPLYWFAVQRGLGQPNPPVVSLEAPPACAFAAPPNMPWLHRSAELPVAEQVNRALGLLLPREKSGLARLLGRERRPPTLTLNDVGASG